MERLELKSKLKSMVNINGHVVGAAIGNGMVADYSIKGGADLLLIMNAGRFRQMGQSAFMAFFGYADANELTLDFATKEILPITNDFPVARGVFMQDPCIYLLDVFKETKEYGFSGVTNYPTVGCFNGKFREALEEAGLGYEKEIEGIRLAHFLGLFTFAFVFDMEQAVEMVKAGADAICLHFGITGGGIYGANKVISMEMAIEEAKKIFEKIDEINPDVLKFGNSGPIQTPIDSNTFIQHTNCDGVMLGSPVERIPVERAVINTMKAFKSSGDFDERNIIIKTLSGSEEDLDYAQFMLEYVQKNYQKVIRLKDLSSITHMSISRLSVLFKEKTGTSFTQYLIDYRMERACELLCTTTKQMKEISSLVGYDDYSQFVKMFRKVIGTTPQEYRKDHMNATLEGGSVNAE